MVTGSLWADPKALLQHNQLLFGIHLYKLFANGSLIPTEAPSSDPPRYLCPSLLANTALAKSTAAALSVETGLVKGTDRPENFHVDRDF